MSLFRFTKPFNAKKSLVVLSTCWLLLQVLLYRHFGIVTAYESAKYIDQADNILQTGHYSSGNFLFYSIEILVIAFSKITGTFPWSVVLIQMSVNAVSIVLFYKLALSMSNSHFRSFIVTFLFITMYYYQLYNVHLFTESLYFSFGIIYTYLLFSIPNLSFKNILLLILGLSVLYFTRPTGLFFIPSTIVFILFKFYRKKALLLLSIFITSGLILLYLLLNFALKSGGEFDFLLPYLDERVLCGVPTIQGQNNIVVPLEKNSVEGLWYIITHHPSLFFDLAGRRLTAFWGVVRPYYSLTHNLFIGFYFYGAYVLIILGLKKLVRKFIPQIVFFLCTILLVMITVALSCDEWHNRFILALLPFFLLMACGGLTAKTKIVDPE